MMGLYDTCSYQSTRGRQVFGVCCNNTVPDVLPEEPKNEEALVDDENDAIVDEFPIEGQAARRSCGFRSLSSNSQLLVRPALPQVTLYNQSPNPALNFYRALLPTSYIVNGQEAVAHEFPWMVRDEKTICDDTFSLYYFRLL